MTPWETLDLYRSKKFTARTFDSDTSVDQSQSQSNREMEADSLVKISRKEDPDPFNLTNLLRFLFLDEIWFAQTPSTF